MQVANLKLTVDEAEILLCLVCASLNAESFGDCWPLKAEGIDQARERRVLETLKDRLHALFYEGQAN
jgi:hypothetical protein